jgi:hypothetical protein
MMWDQTKQLPKELLKKVEDTYREHFSLEVRLQLAPWIEEKFSPTTAFNVDDPAHQTMAISLANQLMTQLEARIAGMPNDPDQFLMKGKLGEISAQLKQTYMTNPLGLYMSVRHCLEQEMNIVQSAPAMSGGDMMAANRKEIANMKQQMSQTRAHLDRIKQEQETFSTEYYDFKGKIQHFEHFKQQHGETHPDMKKMKASKDSMEKHIRAKYLNLSSARQDLVQSEIEIFKTIYAN